MAEHDPLVMSYVHLSRFSRADEALRILKKVASLVKPIMRARNWKVRELAEFYPDQQNLLGLNVNRGKKICLRLRFPGDRTLFLPIENIIDTMLHELAHIVHGPHDGKFHALWDQLRDEHEGLVRKGYTGEGFLSNGQRLGGRNMPAREVRRAAREAADKRRVPPAGGGKRLGGAAPRPGQDIRRVIAGAAEARAKTLRGCATEQLSEVQIVDLADTATRNGFRTQAEEDEANADAISQALWELVQEDDQVKYGQSYIPPTAENPTGNGGGAVMAGSGSVSGSTSTAETQTTSGFVTWTCGVCTLVNPSNYLCCDACGQEKPVDRANPQLRGRPSPHPPLPPPPGGEDAKTNAKTGKTAAPLTATIDLTSSPPRDQHKQRQEQAAANAPQAAAPQVPQTWQCSFCGTEMARKWWTCSTCGLMKDSSR